LESRVRPLRISLPMTTMQAVTVFADSDMQHSFSFSFRTLAEACQGAKRRTALLAPMPHAKFAA
jgi:hypothetical protein